MATIDQDDLVAFVDSVRRLLADRSTEADVRRTMESPEGYDPALWRELASMGVAGLLIDARHGGVGAGPVELERVMEEMGAALACTPMLSSGVLAAGLLQALDDADAQARLLPGIADGSCIATVALTGPKAGWTLDDVAVTARQASDGWRLDGQAGYVTHGQVAGLLLVVARTPNGIGLFELPVNTQGVQVTPLPVFDRTQPLANLSLAGAAARRLACKRPGWEAVEDALDLARVALAGEQAGAARRVLEATVAYAQDRFQFGRAIGSFQAIKHMAADLLLESESCTSAARHAARCLADGDAEAPQAVCLAAFACADAFSTVAATSIQMHGGIAFTWAHPAHLYLRRARADAQLFGAPAAYRERYVQLLEAQA
ncbi:MAG TPA: acyl-CoA dehydrogenase family protein [Quisquiliibacterium sp.]|nr:acyl-CoA dehydrogenase family protein [Quisquiliibacterium sp.]